MDGGVTDGVAPVNGRYLQAKEAEYVAKAEGTRSLGSHEMIKPTEGEYPVDTNSDIPCSSAHCRGDDGVMVEELTLKNYDGKNLAAVGSSDSRGGAHGMPTQWQNLYQIAGGLGRGKGYVQVSGAWQDSGKTMFPELLSEKPHDSMKNDEMEHLTNNDNGTSAGIRTKILSRSGFSEFFVKNSLKGKGIVCKGPVRKGYGVEFRSTSNLNTTGAATVSNASFSLAHNSHAALSNASMSLANNSHAHMSNASLSLAHNSHAPVSNAAAVGPRMSPPANASPGGMTLREWLKVGRRRASKIERLYLFRQILDLVNQSHSQGFALQHLRPSFFNLLTSNKVVYSGSSVPQESKEGLSFRDNTYPENNRPEKRPSGQFLHLFGNQSVKKQKSVDNQMFIRNDPQFTSRSGSNSANGKYTNELRREYDSDSSNYYLSIPSQQVSSYASDPLEESWYASPEERSGLGWSFSSNIYVLGVLLFELLSCFDSESTRATAMSDLRHRILPPDFLSENPKEAGFCLWLLHPEPSSRPTAREVLKSEVISGIEESFGHELSSSIEEDDEEAELVSHFLTSLQEKKQKDSMKLEEEIKCIEADIQEIIGRRTGKPFDFSFSSEPHVKLEELSSSQLTSKGIPKPCDETRFVKNISQLESAYFSMRTDIQNSNSDVATHRKSDLLRERDNKYQKELQEEKHKASDRVGDFFSGLCKYARYSKFEVRGVLRNREFHSSANVICSMSFDRDQEYFATAGISKKIKVFEFQSLFNEAVDVHYPAVEMPNKSRLSCVCWNSYIRNYLASTDYDGSVKLWDAGTGQVVSEYSEHRKRAWSVDFSQVDPTQLASGSDDYSVKLWSINEKNSIRTIKSAANACCVQFSGHSSHLLAFGCADYKTYCYDLRHTSVPWCILAGHDKAVSYVKFLDSETLVSASTDNTLKTWDLNKTSSSGSSASACILTSKGHTNEKNFVGLSASDGYIACGSETNEVYAYYRSLPMPVTSHKFGTIDPVSGKDTDDDNGQFVSSVCWKQNSDMLLAANCSGCIKVLQMV